MAASESTVRTSRREHGLLKFRFAKENTNFPFSAKRSFSSLSRRPEICMSDWQATVQPTL
jgi:hypothetical protein